MPKFSVWITETTQKKIIFEAENYENAKRLIEEVSDYETELPEYVEQIKDFSAEVDYQTLTVRF